MSTYVQNRNIDSLELVHSDEHPNAKLMVVGPPRGGFTLLISILNILYRIRNTQNDDVQQTINHFIPLIGDFIDKAMVNFFKKHINLNNLFYSKEFRLLMGGPKWLDSENRDIACIRKYLGIRDIGDCTFIQYLPKCVLDYDEVVHSHSHPKIWTEDPYYKEYQILASMRNPIDIIHSSVYSINALASEYITRCVNKKEANIRLELALYKLTDLDFLEGLLTFLSAYFKEFFEVKDNFLYIMKWEDLIAQPEETITQVAESSGMKISDRFAKQIWREIDHRNLTRWHQHSFRKGVLNDWRQGLSNSHLEIFKNNGFNEVLEEFGYEKIKYFNPRNYNRIQKKIEKYIRKGRVYKSKVDENLFSFAFNKSNFVSSKFDFKTYPKEGGIKIERSTFKDEDLLKGFMQKMGGTLTIVNEFLNDIKSMGLKGREGEAKGLKALEAKYYEQFRKEFGPKEMKVYKAAFENLRHGPRQVTPPILIDSYKAYNIVSMNNTFYGIPQSLGPLDLQKENLSLRPEIVRGDTIDRTRAMVDRDIQEKNR